MYQLKNKSGTLRAKIAIKLGLAAVLCLGACSHSTQDASGVNGISSVLGQRANGFLAVHNDFGQIKAADANSQKFVDAVNGSIVFALVECAAMSGVQAEVWLKNLEIQTTSTVHSGSSVGLALDQARKMHAPAGAVTDPSNYPCALMGTRLISYPVLVQLMSFAQSIANNPRSDVWEAAQTFYLLLRGFSYDANPGMYSPMLDAMKLAQGLHEDQATDLDALMQSLDKSYNPCNTKTGAAVTAKGLFNCTPLQSISISTFLPKGGDIASVQKALGKVGAYIDSFHSQYYKEAASLVSAPAGCTPV